MGIFHNPDYESEISILESAIANRNAELDSRVDDMLTLRSDIKNLHSMKPVREWDGSFWCISCNRQWPCPTWQIADGNSYEPLRMVRTKNEV